MISLRRDYVFAGETLYASYRLKLFKWMWGYVRLVKNHQHEFSRGITVAGTPAYFCTKCRRTRRAMIDEVLNSVKALSVKESK